MPVLTVGLAGMGVILGCGNFTSVYFPQYVRQMQRGVLSLVMLLLAALLLIPVFFHQVVTRLVAPRILERAPEILAVVTREEG